MKVELELAAAELDPVTRIDILAGIAEGMSRETGGTPHDAILSLLAAAAYVAAQNAPGKGIEADLRRVLTGAARVGKDMALAKARRGMN